MIDQPIRKSMNKLKAIRRMVQWVVELNQFDIEYSPRIAIKAQALANFITEFTIPDEEIQDELGRWTIQIDGSSTRKKGGVGFIINTLERDVLRYVVQLQFPTTNNEAKYEAILTGLRIRRDLVPGTYSFKAILNW